ncbi:MAG: hypothetical protein P1V81_17325 [Planctomycetota bacterium]|nr:hypothetical protein [Planctomycetota bacterium]
MPPIPSHRRRARLEGMLLLELPEERLEVVAEGRVGQHPLD